MHNTQMPCFISSCNSAQPALSEHVLNTDYCGHTLTPHEAVVDKSWIDIGREWLVLTASHMGEFSQLNAILLQQVEHTDRSLTTKRHLKVSSAEGHHVI